MSSMLSGFPNSTINLKENYTNTEEISLYRVIEYIRILGIFT